MAFKSSFSNVLKSLSLQNLSLIAAVKSSTTSTFVIFVYILVVINVFNFSHLCLPPHLDFHVGEY